jgi:hypothetical protein
VLFECASCELLRERIDGDMDSFGDESRHTTRAPKPSSTSSAPRWQPASLQQP